MTRPGLSARIVDQAVVTRAAQHLGRRGVVLPTFAELAEPWAVPSERARPEVDPDAPDPANLFRVHWHNGRDRRALVDVPDHVVLPPELTGVEAPIVVVFGDRFPMIGSHKVLPAYGCLAPRLATGAFDPVVDRAVWPSTGNYCRGGVAISRIMGCRGVAVLPEGMSRERFEWLLRWVADASDVIRTPGTESNVKEIYDRCAELEREPGNVVLNQFAEFGNHLVHWFVTGRALARVVDRLRDRRPGLRVHAFVCGTGSAGTIAAGDHLKEQDGATIVAVEALECPTLTENGFGEHNIQGIGDKHVPLIHNVMNTDAVVAVSDRGTDRLNVLFNTAAGHRYLGNRRGVPNEILAALPSLGLSSIANVLAAIRLARHEGLGPEDLLVTVATDGARMYASEREAVERRDYPDGFDEHAAALAFAAHVEDAGPDRVTLLDEAARRRIFNLGYFTWVEQQGVAIDAFVDRLRAGFWKDLRALIPAWDERIREFNERATAGSASRAARTD